MGHLSYTVRLSAKLFWGWQFTVTAEEVYGLSLLDQSRYVTLKAKTQLMQLFKNNGLDVLAEEADTLTLHLHEMLCTNKINYACDHDHSNNA